MRIEQTMNQSLTAFQVHFQVYSVFFRLGFWYVTSVDKYRNRDRDRCYLCPTKSRSLLGGRPAAHQCQGWPVSVLFRDRRRCHEMRRTVWRTCWPRRPLCRHNSGYSGARRRRALGRCAPRRLFRGKSSQSCSRSSVGLIDIRLGTVRWSESTTARCTTLRDPG